MNRYITHLFLFLAQAITGAIPSHALEFSVHPGNKSENLTAVFASGTIELSDDEKLRHFLHQLPKRENKAIYLSSPGGSLYGGIRLGLFFRNNRVKTIIEGGAECASACALAFLGGTDNNGEPWRSSSDNARLGFHAFRETNSKAISSDEVQKTVADILAYGRSVQAPLELLIVNFMTPSSEITWISNENICKLGIKLWSVRTEDFVCQ